MTVQSLPNCFISPLFHSALRIDAVRLRSDEKDKTRGAVNQRDRSFTGWIKHQPQCPCQSVWAEKGFVTEHDSREFTFTNAAMLHTRNDPAFFKGTVVEGAVADELEKPSPGATA